MTEMNLGPYDQAMQNFERNLIIGFLVVTKGNICKAADQSGLHRNTIQRKVKDFHLEQTVHAIKQGIYHKPPEAA